ncbi:MAG: TolB family protein [Planctomycetota bacterium]
MRFARSIVAPWLAGLLLVASALGQVTERINVSSAEVQANNSQTFDPRLSGDGRIVAFFSHASNLVSGDTNAVGDIFVRDRLSGTTRRVSVDSGEAQATGNSSSPALSRSGRFVAFQSNAANLVVSDTNALEDIFVRDRLLGTTERVSLNSLGTQGNGPSLFPAISADGRFVAFRSIATNLVTPATSGSSHIFVHDRQLGTTELVSVDSLAVEGNADSYAPSISDDGRFVAFQSFASNLVAADTNGMSDIFVRDRQAGTTERVSLTHLGGQTTDGSDEAAISGDGNCVVFLSTGSDLVPGDTNGASDVFVRDLLGATTERVSVDGAGAQGNGHSVRPSISRHGRYVHFQSSASNLVPGDTNGVSDTFLRDRIAGTIVRTSVSTAGAEGNLPINGTTSIAAEGSAVAFTSLASNLVTGDTNGFQDAFVRTLGAEGTGTVSVGADGLPGNGSSGAPALSADSSVVAFESSATNLVAADANGVQDVFVYDRAAATTSLASVDSAEAAANGASARPSVSSDGRYVAFDSVATNLAAGDTNGVSDVFVRDRQAGTTARVSVDSLAGEADGASFRPSISSDGRYVAFDSVATDLVAADTNAVSDVFVHDRQTGTTVRASVGSEGNGPSTDPSISGDGRYVVFESAATNLVASDANAALDVFLRDLTTLVTSRVSVGASGAEGDGDSTNPSISSDGRWVAFQSAATNFVPGDTNLSVDTFSRNLSGGLATTVRTSVDSGGTQGLSGGSTDPSISADGRRVAFQSAATNLVPGDTNLSIDVFVRDLLLDATERVSVDSGGTQGATSSERPSISADGLRIAFDSSASNLSEGDTNGVRDVFLREEGIAAAITAFCFGDGTAAHCPCGNIGASGHGCENSAGTGGALLSASGFAKLSLDTVELEAMDLAAPREATPTGAVVFFQGRAPLSASVFGDGLLCVGGLTRLYSVHVSGDGAVAPGPGDPSITARSTARGVPITLGSTRAYQMLYRDPSASFCPAPSGGTINTSNGVAIAWGP